MLAVDFQRGQIIQRTFWVLVPCFRVNPSVEICVSIRYLSKFQIYMLYMLPTLQQKRKMGRFPFEGKGLQQVETQDGVVVHLPEQLFEGFSSNNILSDDLEESEECHLCQWN